MPNDLTGDFDIVAEFTLGAANRVLAAMHCGGRLPHSWSLQVDDYTHHHVPLSGYKAVPVIRAIVDSFGDAVADPGRTANPSGARTISPGSTPLNPAVDIPVNTPKSVPRGQSSRSIRHNPEGQVRFRSTNWRGRGPVAGKSPVRCRSTATGGADDQPGGKFRLGCRRSHSGDGAIYRRFRHDGNPEPSAGRIPNHG